jgi:putative tricarboxylic transport membrane protein
MPNRFGVWGCAALAAIAFAAPDVAAQWKPERNVEIVVGTGPGGGQDKTARLMQLILQERKIAPVPVSVVNKPGGGGSLGWTYLNQHPGDSHYLGVGNPTLISNQIVGRSTLSHTDVTPIAILFTESVAITVREDSSIRNGRDLIERLQKDGSSISFSVGSSIGSANHIAMAQIAKGAGADPRQMRAVVFQGGGAAVTALLGGHVDLIASAANNVVPHVGAGKLRVIGITAPQRLSGPLATVPTWREQGADVVVSNWRMVAGPRGMAPQAVQYWELALAQMVAQPEWKKDLELNSFEHLFLTGGDARNFLKSEYAAQWRTLSDLGLAKAPPPK